MTLDHQTEPEVRVVDEAIDPTTGLVLLKYDDGSVEVTSWRAERFSSGAPDPRFSGCRGAEQGAGHEAPTSRCSTVARWRPDRAPAASGRRSHTDATSGDSSPSPTHALQLEPRLRVGRPMAMCQCVLTH